jgi:hypothetical protein
MRPDPYTTLTARRSLAGLAHERRRPRDAIDWRAVRRSGRASPTRPRCAQPDAAGVAAASSAQRLDQFALASQA